MAITVDGFAGVDNSTIHRNIIYTYGANVGISLRNVKALANTPPGQTQTFRYLEVSDNIVTMLGQTGKAQGIELNNAALGLIGNYVGGTPDGTAQNADYKSNAIFAGRTEWQAALSRFSVLKESMILKDSLLRQASDSQAQTLLAEKTGLQNEYDSISNVLTTWWSAQVAQRDLQLAQLTVQNNAITTGANVQATNERSVNRALLSRVLPQNRNLSSQDYSDLAAIAAQCALDGGAAVHRARAILDWAKDTSRIWPENCGSNVQGPGEDRNGAIRTEGSTLYRVFPNPATSDLVVECQGIVTDRDLRATLYNTFGQPILQAVLTGPTNPLSLREMPAGVYWLTIREKGRMVHQQVIIKN